MKKYFVTITTSNCLYLVAESAEAALEMVKPIKDHMANSPIGCNVDLSADAVEDTLPITAKDVLRSTVIEALTGSGCDVDEWDGCVLLPYLPMTNLPKTHPLEDPQQLEEVAFENCDIIDMTADTLTVIAGGDWQEPLKFTLTFDPSTGTFRGNDDARPTTDEWLEPGLSRLAILGVINS